MKALLRILVSGSLTFALASHLPAQDKLYPADEASKDPSFKSFRDKLLEAARSHDKEFVLSVLDPQITNSFGGDGGIEEFIDRWKLEERDSALWEELETVIRLGCVLDGSPGNTYFSCPYVFRRLPPKYDSFEYGAIVGANTPIRSEPDSKAPVVTRLSYDIVRLLAWIPDEKRPQCRGCGWHHIRTLDGREGYAARNDARSPIDYRAIFQKKNGHWVMTAFVAGD